MKMNNKDFIAFLKENRSDEDGNIDLNNLNFGKFDKNINISRLTTRGNLYINNSTIGGDLKQNNQSVGGNLDQSQQIVKGNLIQTRQKFKGKMTQNEQYINTKKDCTENGYATYTPVITKELTRNELIKILGYDVKISDYEHEEYEYNFLNNLFEDEDGNEIRYYDF